MKACEIEREHEGSDQEKQKALFLSAQSGCQSARDQLILLNQGLVVFLAKKMNQSEEWEDLIQEGNLGLMKAIDRYDPRLGYTFSTYASWWIKQSIQHYLFRVRPLISFGKDLNQRIIQADHIRQNMMQQLNREVSDEEVAEEMKISLKKMRKIQKAASDSITLFIDANEKLNENRISISDENSLHEEVMKKQLVESLLLALSSLNEREQKILILHYGVGQERSLTLQEIGNQMNLSKERIRQIENQSLQKLRLFFEKDMRYNED